jgi:hypothetical protein
MLSKSIIAGKYYWHGKEITEAEYNHILEIIHNKPTSPEGYGYRLTETLEWELYELPIVEDEDISEAEALDIILGGAV